MRGSSASASSSPRKHGNEENTCVNQPSSQEQTLSGRKRGRPRNVSTQKPQQRIDFADSDAETPPAKRPPSLWQSGDEEDEDQQRTDQVYSDAEAPLANRPVSPPPSADVEEEEPHKVKSEEATHKCEDPWHVASALTQRGGIPEVRKSAEDGVFRCSQCCTYRKRAEKTVGSRGLTLKAFFRTRPTQPPESTAPPQPPRSIATPVASDAPVISQTVEETPLDTSAATTAIARSGEVGSGAPTTPPPRGLTRWTIANSTTKGQDVSPTPAGISPPFSAFSEQSTVTKPRHERDADWAGYASDDDEEEARKCDNVDLWLGCDKCVRWFMVDHLLEAHWRDEEFVCSDIGESCEAGEPYDPNDAGAPTTALVRLHGAERLRSRGDGTQNRGMPLGCWDVYRKGSQLCDYRPSSKNNGLVVFAAPLAETDEATRLEAETVLHAGFKSKGARNCITALCGLREGIRLLRSGSRAHAVVGKDGQRMWLIWQTMPVTDSSGTKGRRTVGAAILHWQQYVKTGPKHLRGGAVLEYIAAEKASGARGYPLVLAAEEVCRLLGMKEIFSACDLSHKGQAFGGNATPALTAHRRWGFQDIAPEEWDERRFGQYTRDSSVHFMVKQLNGA